MLLAPLMCRLARGEVLITLSTASSRSHLLMRQHTLQAEILMNSEQRC